MIGSIHPRPLHKDLWGHGITRCTCMYYVCIDMYVCIYNKLQDNLIKENEESTIETKEPTNKTKGEGIWPFYQMQNNQNNPNQP